MIEERVSEPKAGSTEIIQSGPGWHGSVDWNIVP